MPGACVGGGISKVVVPTREAFLHHAAESALAKGGGRRSIVPSPKTGEVVRTHLVDGDPDDEFGVGVGGRFADEDFSLEGAT